MVHRDGGQSNCLTFLAIVGPARHVSVVMAGCRSLGGRFSCRSGCHVAQTSGRHLRLLSVVVKSQHWSAVERFSGRVPTR